MALVFNGSPTWSGLLFGPWVFLLLVQESRGAVGGNPFKSVGGTHGGMVRRRRSLAAVACDRHGGETMQTCVPEPLRDCHRTDPVNMR